MDRIRIAGLVEAVQCAATIDTPRRVLVTSVTVRHAPALLELLEGQVQQRGWSIYRIGRLRKLSNLDSELTVVAEVLIPILSKNPLDAAAGRALHRYGSSVSRLARSHGGAPLDPFNEVGRLLRRHTLDANNIDDVLGKVLALKDVKVDFPPEVADADADAEEEEEEEEEEEDEDEDDEEEEDDEE